MYHVKNMLREILNNLWSKRFVRWISILIKQMLLNDDSLHKISYRLRLL